MIPTTFYYTQDKQVFSNKIDAVVYSKKNKQQLFFYYHDHIYSSLNWSIEPPGTLDFYYKEQAQRIRDEYDYVVLFYSGGYDSTNILETFYYNNIALDKIVCVGAFKQDSSSGVDENHNGEIYKNCFPVLSQLGLENIVQICDYSEYFNTPVNFSVYKYGSDWSKNIGPWYSLHNWFWKDIHKYVVPANMSGKRVALIWGKDKPNVSIVNRECLFQFSDKQALSYGGEVVVDGVDRINFYWDFKNPQLLIKQVHHLKNISTGLEVVNADKVYNIKNKLVFKSPKSPTNILSLRDSFIKNHLSSDVFKFYKSGIQAIGNQLDIKYDLVPIKSRTYRVPL